MIGQSSRIRRRDVVVVALLLGALTVTGFLIARQAGPQSSIPTMNAEARQYLEQALYAAEPGERGGEETLELSRQDAYWNTRYTYPTGRADRQWLVEAELQDRAVPDGMPGGQVTYDGGAENQSPLALDPNRWIGIGPQPQDSNTCEVCFPFGIVAGRVNDAVIDPISPTIAYIAVDGGGVWKTTNCCTRLDHLDFDHVGAGYRHHSHRRPGARPHQPHRVRGHGRPALRLVLVRQQRHAQEHRPGGDLAHEGGGRVRYGATPAGGPVPAVQTRWARWRSTRATRTR